MTKTIEEIYLVEKNDKGYPTKKQKKEKPEPKDVLVDTKEVSESKKVLINAKELGLLPKGATLRDLTDDIRDKVKTMLFNETILSKHYLKKGA